MKMAEMQEDEILSEIDAVSEEMKEQSAESVEPQVSETKPDDEIPEKYRGKPLKQIVEELEHANKSMGRYANELGEVRRLADELIKSQLKPKEEIKEVDFFENPQEAIRKQIESNPEVLAAKNYAVQARQQMAKQALAQKHPDFSQIVQDKEFADWVRSSKVRIKLFQEAESYDLDAADELFSTFKQLKGVRPQEVKVDPAEKAARQASLKSASVETSGSGESSKKIYRRADLINMKLSDPSKFERMQDEIDAAYREGRVK
jgi:hypothetical protein